MIVMDTTRYKKKKFNIQEYNTGDRDVRSVKPG